MSDEITAEAVEQNGKPKKSQELKDEYNRGFKHGALFGVMTIFVIFGVGGFFIIRSAEKKEEAYRKTEEGRKAFVADSTAKAEMNKRTYVEMMHYMHQVDSAKSTLRYKIGDIVYLKPDSTRGVVEDLSSDSLRITLEYMLITSNKDGHTVYQKTKDKLIY